MALNNYTTKVAAHTSIAEIQALLAKKGARAITVVYADSAPVGITFEIAVQAEFFVYRLPCRMDGALYALRNQEARYRTRQHAANVAWRNIKDWVQAQLAIIEMGQADLAEVMLPYLLASNDQTVYQIWQARNLLVNGDA